MQGAGAGLSGALCASPQCGVRASRNEFFAIVGKNLPERKVYLRETPACASDYNLPPSLREVSRQSRDGGSFCSPCAREGGAAKLRRKGCRVIIRCKRLHLLCLLRPNLPLTRLSEKGECAVRYYVSPDGTAQRKNGGQARSAAPDGFPQITKIFRPFGRKIL